VHGTGQNTKFATFSINMATGKATIPKMNFHRRMDRFFLCRWEGLRHLCPKIFLTAPKKLLC